MLAGAVVVVAEMQVEVVDDAVRPPPADRHEIDVGEAERSDGSRYAEQRPREPPQVVATQDERPSEEVRADRDHVVAQRERDGVSRRVAAERGLRDDRVHRAEQSERECDPVPEPRAEGQSPLLHCVAQHPEEGNGEQDLLPRGDRRQRRAADAGGIERRHDGVVRGEPDEEEIERRDRHPPDRDRRDGEEQCVEP